MKNSKYVIFNILVLYLYYKLILDILICFELPQWHCSARIHLQCKRHRF